MPLDPAEVSRIIDAGMARNAEKYEWIDKLSQEQLMQECEKRGLPNGGIIPTLRARLRKYEAGMAELREEISSESDVQVPRLRNGSSLEGLPRPDSVSPVTRSEDRDAGRVPQWPRPELPAGHAMGEESTPWRRPPPVPTGAIPREARPRLLSREERGTDRRGRLTPLEIGKWMKQWEITFSGSRGADAADFVQKVRQLRAVAPVADRDLFLCLPFYLKGLALSWYREKQSRLQTWAQFEEGFLQRFAMQGTRAVIGEEIRRRTQGEQEPVADYFACLYALFRRLDPPWSASEQLERAHLNLLPKIQMWIPRRQIRDLDELERLAIQVEEDLHLAEQYKAPPPPEKAVCPEWAYKPPKRTARSNAAIGEGMRAAAEGWHPRTDGEQPGEAAVAYQAEGNRDSGPAVTPRGGPSLPRE